MTDPDADPTVRRITLVMKTRADGRLCRKCSDVFNRLQRDGHLGAIDQIVIADECDPRSEVHVFTAYLRFKKHVLHETPDERDEIEEIMARNPDLDFI